MSKLANRSADFTSLVTLPLATPFARDTRFLLQRSVPRLVWVWDLWDFTAATTRRVHSCSLGTTNLSYTVCKRRLWPGSERN